jgi:hypothetical protein
MDTDSDLPREIAELLFDNASFWRSDENDEALYFVGPDTILQLAYECVQVGANLLGFGVPLVSGALLLRQRISDKRNDPSRANDAVNSLDHPTDESEDCNPSSAESRSTVIGEIKTILMRHGWPEREAQADAERSYEAMRKHIVNG